MTQERHFDVAAYALGVLDPRDAARFEDHLIDCAACAVELETMLPVVDVLAEIDAQSLVAVEQERRDNVVLHKVIGKVGVERQRARSRRLYSLAAAVVAFAALAVGAMFAGGQWLAPTSQQAQPQATASPQFDPLPPTDGPGVGGPDLPGERFGRTDARTGVRADVGMESVDWGTQVSLVLSNIKGPLACRLVAVRTNGEQEVLSTWTVGERGWGTTEHPKPLLLGASTWLPRDEIAHVQVQAMDSSGATQTLVRVP